MAGYSTRHETPSSWLSNAIKTGLLGSQRDTNLQKRLANVDEVGGTWCLGCLLKRAAAGLMSHKLAWSSSKASAWLMVAGLATLGAVHGSAGWWRTTLTGNPWSRPPRLSGEASGARHVRSAWPPDSEPWRTPPDSPLQSLRCPTPPGCGNASADALHRHTGTSKRQESAGQVPEGVRSSIGAERCKQDLFALEELVSWEHPRTGRGDTGVLSCRRCWTRCSR